MTVDFNQRKSAKAKWKRHGRAAAEKAAADKGAKRIRKKPNAKRRLCKGMCYGSPSDIRVDKVWRDEENSDEEGKAGAAAYDSDVEEQKQRDASRIASGTQATTSDADGAAKAKQPKQQQRKDGKQGIKLSTGVKLMDPQAAAQTSSKPVKRAAAEAGPALQPFHALIQGCMAAQGFIEPTPIQEKCWPACCEGKDVQGVAEPGSGKTLAYLLPGAVRVKEAGHDATTLPDGPLVLVLAPTRELAMQVAQQGRNLRATTGLRTGCVYGGIPKDQQEELLKKRPHILVATPGRLLDLLDSGATTLSQVCYVVLDEADKMLSLGFQPQLDRLHQLLLGAHPEPAAEGKGAAKGKGKGKAGAAAEAAQAVAGVVAGARPQVLLFTATMPAEVEGAAGRWLRRPVRVVVTHSAASISRTITQVVQVCAEHKKPAKLLKHLGAVKEAGAQMRNPPRVLVFANRIKTVRFLHDTVAKEGYRVVMLHGQRSQVEREEAMKAFRSGKSQVMIATDVAARGLDIRALPYVVNYDFPSRLETYIHRVGRTGRLAANGHAFSFFTRNLAKLAGPLVSLLSEHEQAVDPNLLQLAEAWGEAVRRAGGEEALEAQLKGSKQSGGDGEDEEEEEEGEDELETLMHLREEAMDVMEGLRAVGALSHLSGKKKAKKGRDDGADDGDGGEERAGKKAKVAAGAAEGAAPSMQQRLAKAKVAGAQEAAAKEEVAAGATAGAPFIASPKFAGRRPGYMFKQGKQGLGYYVDHGPKVSKKKLSAAALKEKGKGPIIAVERGKHSWSDDDSESDGEADKAAAVPNAGKGKGKGKGVASAGGASGQQQQQKRKALPGRLRKKLAKEQAAGKGK